MALNQYEQKILDSYLKDSAAGVKRDTTIVREAKNAFNTENAAQLKSINDIIYNKAIPKDGGSFDLGNGFSVFKDTYKTSNAGWDRYTLKDSQGNEVGSTYGSTSDMRDQLKSIYAKALGYNPSVASQNLGTFGLAGDYEKYFKSLGLVDKDFKLISKSPIKQLSDAEVSQIKADGQQKFNEQTGFDPSTVQYSKQGTPEGVQGEFQSYDPNTQELLKGKEAEDFVNGKFGPEYLTGDKSIPDLASESDKLNADKLAKDSVQYYGKERVQDLNTEKNAANDLAQFLDTKKVGDKTLRQTITADNWSTYVNAYLYGGYSLEDIGNDLYSRATGKGGGIVHPTIGRNEWLNANPELTKPGGGTAVTGANASGASGSSGASGGTGTELANGDVADAPVSPLDNIMNILLNYNDELSAVRNEANSGLEKESQDITDAQKDANDVFAQIESLKEDYSLQDILDIKDQKDLKDKITNQDGVMSSINREFNAKLQDMTFDQKIDAMVRMSAINQKVNEYNAQLQRVSIEQGQYDRASEQVQRSVEDWKSGQEMALEAYTLQYNIQKDEKEAYQKIIERQAELQDDGHVPISTEQKDMIINDLGITAGTYSKFFLDDPITGRTYLKSSDSETVEDPKIQIIGQETDEWGNSKNVYGYWQNGSLVRTDGAGAGSNNFDISTPDGQYSTFNQWINSVGTVTQDYDTPVSYFADGRKTHGGIDIAGKMGDAVYSPISGRVVEAQSSNGWGTSVVIQDANGNKWRMAHFQNTGVRLGDEIQIGQEVGKLGNTGYVLKGDGTKPSPAELAQGAGTHLHMEVKDTNGNLINPRTLGQSQQKSALDFTLDAWAEEKAQTGKMPNDVPAHLVGQVNEMAKGIKPDNKAGIASAESRLSLINNIFNSSALDNVVGPNYFTRMDAGTDFTGSRDDVTGWLKQLTSQETLNNLIKIKEAGGTFGALSEKELQMLIDSATAIGGWQKEDDGKVYWEATEKSFKAQLDILKEMALKDLIRSGGDISGNTKGVVRTEDGKLWLKKSNGDIIEIK